MPSGSPQLTAIEACAGKEPVPIFSTTDLVVLLGLPVLFGLSWFTPERSWRWLCRAIGPLAVPMLAGDTAAVVDTIDRTFPDPRLARSPKALLQELAGEQVLSNLQLLRDYRPGGWSPKIRLTGYDHVEAALGRGHGVILWVASSVFADLVAKIAFHRAGLAVSHLSRPSHGFSDTRFGMRYLNCLQTAIEDRYLKERIRLAPDGGKAALDALAARLDDNGVVSITVHRNARRPIAVPFLKGEILLAPGAPVLAQRAHASLLPTFAYRAEDGKLTVVIEAPLEIPDKFSRDEAVRCVARDYAHTLEPHVLRFPGQWRGWLHLERSQGLPAAGLLHPRSRNGLKSTP